MVLFDHLQTSMGLPEPPDTVNVPFQVVSAGKICPNSCPKFLKSRDFEAQFRIFYTAIWLTTLDFGFGVFVAVC